MSINGDYLNFVLENCINYGYNGGPSFNTQIVSLLNGKEKRNANWSQPRHQFTLNFNNISKTDYLQLKQLHLNCMGQLKSFKFKDWLDFESKNEDFAIGDGTKKKFQFGKVSIIDNIQYFRQIYCLKSSSIQIFLDDVLVSPSNFTIDENRGTINFNTAPQNGKVLSWSGEFYVWTRFNTDDFPFSFDSIDSFNGTVNLIEVQPPI